MNSPPLNKSSNMSCDERCLGMSCGALASVSVGINLLHHLVPMLAFLWKAKVKVNMGEKLMAVYMGSLHSPKSQRNTTKWELLVFKTLTIKLR